MSNTQYALLGLPHKCVKDIVRILKIKVGKENVSNAFEIIKKANPFKYTPQIKVDNKTSKILEFYTLDLIGRLNQLDPAYLDSKKINTFINNAAIFALIENPKLSGSEILNVYLRQVYKEEQNNPLRRGAFTSRATVRPHANPYGIAYYMQTR